MNRTNLFIVISITFLVALGCNTPIEDIARDFKETPPSRGCAPDPGSQQYALYGKPVSIQTCTVNGVKRIYSITHTESGRTRYVLHDFNTARRSNQRRADELARRYNEINDENATNGAWAENSRHGYVDPDNPYVRVYAVDFEGYEYYYTVSVYTHPFDDEVMALTQKLGLNQ